MLQDANKKKLNITRARLEAAGGRRLSDSAHSERDDGSVVFPEYRGLQIPRFARDDNHGDFVSSLCGALLRLHGRGPPVLHKSLV